MQPYQQRVIDEQNELDEKIRKLSLFIDSETFEKLVDVDRAHLLQQILAMRDYSNILGLRIKRFQ